MSTPTLTQVALGDLEFELAGTRRILERVPDEQAGWRPHEKSMSLGELSTHLSNLPYWFLKTLTEDHFDLATVPSKREVRPREVLLAEFDGHVEAIRAAMASLDETTLGDDCELRHGDHVLFTRTRHAVLRDMCISHMVHHRAQLGVYLRMLDVPLPAIYGPTADERQG